MARRYGCKQSSMLACIVAVTCFGVWLSVVAPFQFLTKGRSRLNIDRKRGLETRNAHIIKERKLISDVASRTYISRNEYRPSVGKGSGADDNTNPYCVKEVLLFGNTTLFKKWPELATWYELLNNSKKEDHESDLDCTQLGYECKLRLTLTLDTGKFRNKDAVIYGMIPVLFGQHMDAFVNYDPTPGQTLIYYGTETPMRLVRWNKDMNVTRIKYHKMMTYRSDSDIPIPYGRYHPYKQDQRKPRGTSINYASNKTHLAAWIASNCGGVFWPRSGYIDRIRSFNISFHDYGKCGRYVCMPKRSEKCNKLLQQYKFFFAFANSECQEYITEKFWTESVDNNVVPVVYGAPRSSFEKLAPPNSFIHVADFSSVESLVQYLQLLDKNDRLYNRYFEWKQEGTVERSFPVHVKELCRILPHLYNGTTQRLKYVGDSTYFTECRTIPGLANFFGFPDYEQIKVFDQWTPWNHN